MTAFDKKQSFSKSIFELIAHIKTIRLNPANQHREITNIYFVALAAFSIVVICGCLASSAAVAP